MTGQAAVAPGGLAPTPPKKDKGATVTLLLMLNCNLMGASLVAQTVKCLPTMQETRVQSLGQKDLLEKEMATHSSILAWRIP